MATLSDGDACPVVKTHRFTYTMSNGRQSTEEFEFRDDAMATALARSLLSAVTIAIAVRRVEPGETIERVGLWIWNHGEPQWKPEQ